MTIVGFLPYKESLMIATARAIPAEKPSVRFYLRAPQPQVMTRLIIAGSRASGINPFFTDELINQSGGPAPPHKITQTRENKTAKSTILEPPLELFCLCRWL